MSRILENVLIVGARHLLMVDPREECPICGCTPDYHNTPGDYSCKPCGLMILVYEGDRDERDH